jgi:hypothetical protein
MVQECLLISRLVAVRAAVLIWLVGTDNFYPGALTWVDCQAEAVQLHGRGDEIETRAYARPISYLVRPIEPSQHGLAL